MLRLHAPAKLNLYLRILGRRPDGYHELETLFERIDLADELTFKPQARGITMTCDDPTLACGASNLVTKAAHLLQQTCNVSQGAAIHLAKRIPIAAGLGGGSSDAAATLIGLNRLWALRLSAQRLRQLAGPLGADVPFFLERGPFAAAKPLKKSSLTVSRRSISMLLHALRNGSLSELASGLRNDLQPEAIRRCPVIQDIQGFLQSCPCLGTMVSGSGPSVFGLCQDRAHAETASRRLREKGGSSRRIAVVKTATR